MAPETRARALTSAVDVSDGRLEGRIEEGIAVYKGIPYAAPPVGARRFRPAAAPHPWSGIRPATAFAAAAPQRPDPGFFPGDPDAMPVVATSEDCLYLNVWAPTDGGPHPVLIWLHGGSQILGGTERPVYDGAVFARRGIVCVTVGFRLGALGYLELGRLLGPAFRESGNAALSDQIAALRWVHREIAAFGGDPARVTLAGESAGAKNIAALMTSPAARHLFQAAIVQSGGGETTHDLATAEAIAERFLALCRRSAADLRTLPVAEVLAIQDDLRTDGSRRFPFRPVHGTALLPLSPIDALRSGERSPHALLIGTARDENGPLIDDVALLAGWRADLLAHRTPEEMSAIERRAADALADLPPAERRRRLLVAEEYRVPSIRFADAHAAAGGSTWMYRFDLELPSGPLAGHAPHTADLSPTWRRAGPYDTLTGRPAEALHETIVRFVQRHAVDWPRYRPQGRSTALFGLRFAVAEDPDRPLLDLFDAPTAPAGLPRR